MKNGMQTNNFDIRRPETFTKQRIFDYVVRKLAEQGRRSRAYDEGLGITFCLYRGPNETKCALGHLIPDEAYTPTMEGPAYGILHIISKYKSELGYLSRFKDLLVLLQDAHDTSGSAEGLKGYLAGVAEEHHLKPAMIATITTWK